MSGKKPPTSTALVRRVSPDLSDADLASSINRLGHLLGRKKVYATLDPDAKPATMRVHNKEDGDAEGSYLIYSEACQRFIGLVRKGTFLMKVSDDDRRSRLVFFPAAQA